MLRVGVYWDEVCGNSVSSYIALVVSVVSFSAVIRVSGGLFWLR